MEKVYYFLLYVPLYNHGSLLKIWYMLRNYLDPNKNKIMANYKVLCHKLIKHILYQVTTLKHVLKVSCCFA